MADERTKLTGGRSLGSSLNTSPTQSAAGAGSIYGADDDQYESIAQFTQKIAQGVHGGNGTSVNGAGGIVGGGGVGTGGPIVVGAGAGAGMDPAAAAAAADFGAMAGANSGEALFRRCMGELGFSMLLVLVLLVSNQSPFATIVALVGFLATSSEYAWHLNPCVTVGLMARGKQPVTAGLLVLLSQCVGATVGALMARFLNVDGGYELTVSPDVGLSFALEFTVAAMFTLPILTLLDIQLVDGRVHSYCLCHGSAVLAAWTVMHPFVGTFANPAIALGLFLAGLPDDPLGDSAVSVFLAPILGAVLAAVLSWLLSLDGTEKQALLRDLAFVSPMLLELLGTCVLVFVLLAAKHVVAVMAIVVPWTLCGWRRSGAHFNPFTSFTVAVASSKPAATAIMYVIVQVLGAFLGLTLYYGMIHPFVKHEESAAYVVGGGGDGHGSSSADNAGTDWPDDWDAVAITPPEDVFTLANDAGDFVLLGLLAIGYGSCFVTLSSEARWQQVEWTNQLNVAVLAVLLGALCGPLPAMGSLLNPVVALVQGLACGWSARDTCIQVVLICVFAVIASIWLRLTRASGRPNYNPIFQR